jgi:hypothetical protein
MKKQTHKQWIKERKKWRGWLINKFPLVWLRNMLCRATYNVRSFESRSVYAHLCVLTSRSNRVKSAEEPFRIRYLRPSGMLRGVHLSLVTDVSGQPIGPIFKGKAVRTWRWKPDMTQFEPISNTEDTDAFLRGQALTCRWVRHVSEMVKIHSLSAFYLTF